MNIKEAMINAKYILGKSSINFSDLDIEIQEVNIEPQSGPQLEDSSIVVSAGRGLG